jgi:Ni/Co efflux regulator RcnB
MRKFILLAAAAAMIVPSAAVAQRYDHSRGDRHETRQDRRDVRHDRRDIRQDRRDVRQDRGNRHEVRQDRRDIRQDRHDVRRDRGDIRQDRRFRDHRRSAYIAPYRGFSYRPVSVGFRLRPAFYSPRYYISDYGYYHLRAPHGRWLRWIRYGDELLLVNIRTGRVLQVMPYGF